MNLGSFAGGMARGISQGIEDKARMDDAEFKKKERDRHEKALGEEDVWKQDRAAFKTSNQRHQERLAEFQRQQAEAAKSPAAAGIAPMAPPQPPGLHDELGDLVELARIDIRHRKASPETLLPLLNGMRQMEDEGMTKALQQAAMGDREGALKTFSSTGSIRDVSGVKFEDSTFDPGTGAKPIKSTTIILPNGQRLDAVGALWAQQQAKDLLGNWFKQETLNTTKAKNEADTKETNRHNVAEEGIHRIAAKAAKTKAEKEAKPPYKTEAGDITSLLGDPAVDRQGNPKTDPLSGRQMVNRNLERERKFFKFMEDSGITDTNEGLQKFLQKEGSASPPAPASRPPLSSFSR